jgi:6,7-dimethyl-8-ribityllumazine synthase
MKDWRATSHFERISSVASKGISNVGLEREVLVAFGVLTTDTIEQATERAGMKIGNKDWNAATSAIEFFNDIRRG